MALAALAAVAPVLLTTAYVSLAAILTRSTVGALVIGLVITTLEQLFRLSRRCSSPAPRRLVGALYQALPGYHLANLGDWLTSRPGADRPLPVGPLLDVGRPRSPSPAWIGSWSRSPSGVFRRQDIN